MSFYEPTEKEINTTYRKRSDSEKENDIVPLVMIVVALILLIVTIILTK